MVQIIRRTPHKTTSDYAAEALGAFGESQGRASAAERLRQAQEQENKALKSTYGIDLAGITDPKVRQVAVGEALKGQRKEQEITNFRKQFGVGEESQRQAPEQQDENIPWYERQEAGEEKPWYMQEFAEEPRPKQKAPEKNKGFDFATLPDEKIAELTIMNPALGREARAAKDSILKQQNLADKATRKRQDDIRKETLPYRQELASRAEAAQRDLDAKEESLRLINTGKLDDPRVATFLEMLPGKMGLSFLSPETVQYKASLVQGYGALKNLFSGATRVKEIEILEAKIADTYYTDEQKLAVINSMARASQNDIIMAEAAQEIEAEAEEAGKPLGILDFRKKVQERTKQKSNALFDRILDEQKAISKEAENIKKMPLDFSNPEHKEIINQINKEAKSQVSNPKNLKQVEMKALEIAKKKGYHWK